MEENKEKKPAFGYAVAYQATFYIKVVNYRARVHTCVVLSDSTCTPAKVKKKLLEDIKLRYAQIPLPVEIEVRRLKKVRGDFVTIV